MRMIFAHMANMTKVSDNEAVVILFTPNTRGANMLQTHISVSCWGPGKVLHNSWKSHRHHKCSGKYETKKFASGKTGHLIRDDVCSSCMVLK